MSDAKDAVIVAGSSGYIGSALIHKLADRYRVVGFDQENPPHPPPVAECVCIDLTSDASVDAAFARVRTAYGERIASVIHLAAYFDLTGEPSPKYDEITWHRAPFACSPIVRGRAIRFLPARCWYTRRASPVSGSMRSHRSLLSLFLRYGADPQANASAEIPLIDKASAVGEDGNAWRACRGHELLLQGGGVFSKATVRRGKWSTNGLVSPPFAAIHASACLNRKLHRHS